MICLLTFFDLLMLLKSRINLDLYSVIGIINGIAKNGSRGRGGDGVINEEVRLCI